MHSSNRFLMVPSRSVKYTVTVFYCCSHESGTSRSISWLVTVYNKNLPSQCNMTAHIEQVQDK